MTTPRLTRATLPSRLRSRSTLIGGAALAVALVAAAGVAFLVATGNAFIALVMLLAIPAALAIHRYPLVAVAVWLLLAPLVMATTGGASRRVFWLVHRLLPLAVVGVVWLAMRLGIRKGKLPRLGVPELMMAGYLVATLVSVAYTSNAVLATTIHVYDRVAVPMLLYLLVRLLQPTERELRRAIPLVVVLLVTQAIFGILSWTAPGLLPGAWLTREMLRTTGSLIHPNVFGFAMLFCGLIVLHHAYNGSLSWARRRVLLLLFMLSLTMVFLSYSRASWLAGIIVLLGLLTMYPRFLVRAGVILVVLVMTLLATGVIAEQVETAQTRFLSEDSQESAGSRLPVVVASVRMFEQKPLVGWGYGNFDRFDRQFQAPIAGFIPEKDHASHNLYLTLLAEQGLIGLALWLGPMVWWLVATRNGWRDLPREGLVNRRFVVSLWLAVLAYVVVTNFSNLRVEFGIGLWWMVLGLIAAIVTQYGRNGEVPASPDVRHSTTVASRNHALQR